MIRYHCDWISCAIYFRPVLHSLATDGDAVIFDGCIGGRIDQNQYDSCAGDLKALFSHAG